MQAVKNNGEYYKSTVKWLLKNLPLSLNFFLNNKNLKLNLKMRGRYSIYCYENYFTNHTWIHFSGRNKILETNCVGQLLEQKKIFYLLL